MYKAFIAFVLSTTTVLAQMPTAWPQTFTKDNVLVTIYQPQIVSWQGTQLNAKAVVEIQSPTNNVAYAYGTVNFSGQTTGDSDNQNFSLANLQVADASFPTAGDYTTSYADIIQCGVGSWARSFPISAVPQGIVAAHKPLGGTAVANPTSLDNRQYANNTPAAIAKPNNVYSGDDGGFYRNSDSGWDHFDNGGWNSNISDNTRDQLNQDRATRIAPVSREPVGNPFPAGRAGGGRR